MPGAVNSFTSGRTYPLEGTTVMFPQKAPFTDPVTLLVCGGSGIDDQAGQALDNCISIQPEVQDPQWILERMVSRSYHGESVVFLPDISAIKASHDMHSE